MSGPQLYPNLGVPPPYNPHHVPQQGFANVRREQQAAQRSFHWLKDMAVWLTACGTFVWSRSLGVSVPASFFFSFITALFVKALLNSLNGPRSGGAAYPIDRGGTGGGLHLHHHGSGGFGGTFVAPPPVVVVSNDSPPSYNASFPMGGTGYHARLPAPNVPPYYPQQRAQKGDRQGYQYRPQDLANFQASAQVGGNPRFSSTPSAPPMPLHQHASVGGVFGSGGNNSGGGFSERN